MKLFKKLVITVAFGAAVFNLDARDRWTPEQANAWYARQPWIVGCNFGPSTAINQLEMWQAESWDPETIDRELGWAEDLGFTSVRVYLHDLIWTVDKEGYLERMERFLTLADAHDIGVMFVLLDGVWDPSPKLGKQREPRPHVHNSGWIQSPGKAILQDPARHDELKDYIIGVLSHFKDDPLHSNPGDYLERSREHAPLLAGARRRLLRAMGTVTPCLQLVGGDPHGE